ncbi:hypothetical protein ScPMuIL_000963 [Solemya velum]
MEARLPVEKVVKVRNLLSSIKKRKKVTLRELQSLLGLLNFCCQVVVPGRAFLRLTSYHRMMGFEDPTQCFLIKKILKGVQNLSAGPDMRLPITPSILDQLISGLEHTSPNKLKEVVSFIGLDTSMYKPHSFRIGAASTAFQCQIPEENIRLMGRWNSDAVVHGTISCIDTNIQDIDVSACGRKSDVLVIAILEEYFHSHAFLSVPFYYSDYVTADGEEREKKDILGTIFGF